MWFFNGGFAFCTQVPLAFCTILGLLPPLIWNWWRCGSWIWREWRTGFLPRASIHRPGRFGWMGNDSTVSIRPHAEGTHEGIGQHTGHVVEPAREGLP